jgi:hypothetical protein
LRGWLVGWWLIHSFTVHWGCSPRLQLPAEPPVADYAGLPSHVCGRPPTIACHTGGTYGKVGAEVSVWESILILQQSRGLRTGESQR